MADLEQKLVQGVKDGKIPHAVVFATNADGSFTYKYATGSKVLGTDDAIAEDAVFLLASSTKLMATIAALQVVEKGLFGLDDDVAKELPELAEQKIITGFDDGDEPNLVARKNKITLRHLLTHAAGTVYDAANPLLVKFSEKRGHLPNTGTTVLERFGYPLAFEPGTSWEYGTGMDWAGKLVERATGETLENYAKKNIWEPLGIKGITCFPYENAALKDKVPALTQRNPEGELLLYDDPFINTGSKDAFGGHGSYGTMGDYLKIQRSILANDGKLLKPSTVEMMFTPQLSAESKEALRLFRYSAYADMVPGEHNPEMETDWGLGGMLYLQDDVGRRKKGTLTWSGMANTFWIIDREADLAFTFGTQVLPPGDRPTAEMITLVEKGVYEKRGVKF